MIWPRPFRPRTSPEAMNGLHRLLERNRLWYAVAVLLERTPPLYAAFTWVERKVKAGLFGCRMCGQCALPATAYACPMTCPKQLRNGPCGGVRANGNCEVEPDMPCVWVQAWKGSQNMTHGDAILKVQKPVNQSLRETSSWLRVTAEAAAAREAAKKEA